MQKILIFHLLIIFVLCNAQLNSKYGSFLSGKDSFSDDTVRLIYKDFVSPYNDESLSRFDIFRSNLIKIRSHNNDNHSWTRGINDFTDMTFKQFADLYLMASQDCSPSLSLKRQPAISRVKVPKKHNWKDLGLISPIKNQMSRCGSCWAFAAVGSLESFWNIYKNGKNQTFSEQQFIDCSKSFGNNGCKGGLPSKAFQYIKQSGGLERDSTYPYKAAEKSKCAFKLDKAIGKAPFGSFNITQGDEKQMEQKLFGKGPITFSFAVTEAFKDYHSGIFDDKSCGSSSGDANHVMLVVAYESEEKRDYWLVKNSWGTQWGKQGFAKIQKGVDLCGMAQCASFPQIFSENQTLKDPNGNN